MLRAAFIMALLLSTLGYAVVFETVQASTDVNGIISSDTTWIQTNSPYSLSGNVLVKDGVTLTIEAGATVNLNSYYILVNGTLQAKGTSTDKILINGIDGSPPPIPLGSSFAISFTYGITINGYSTIENAVINQVRLALGSSNKVNNSTVNGFVSVGRSSFFTSNIVTGVVFAGDNSQILNNNIHGGIETEYGSPTLSNNVISGGIGGGNGIWSYLSENVVISGNVITGCGQGIFAQGGNGIINRNFIADCTEGITVNYGSTVTIKENTIEGNQIGIKLPSAATPIINYNNLQKNSYNVYLGSSASLDATNNWWGTTNESAISQSIYDSKNDFNLGTVNFVPFLTEPNPNAPANPAPTPTPPPTSSPSPTLTPTPSQEPQQTEQIEIIVGTAIAVAVIGAGLGLLIYLTKRK